VTAPASVSTTDVFARERQERIARIVEEHGRARVTDLAGEFGVSAVTIRKDLMALEGDHRLVRTHGGAIAVDHSRTELAFEIRERLQADEKNRIGAAAATLVRDGESIVTLETKRERSLSDAQLVALVSDCAGLQYDCERDCYRLNHGSESAMTARVSGEVRRDGDRVSVIVRDGRTH